MEIIKINDNEKLILQIKGRLDTNTSGQLETTINEIQSPVDLVLDGKYLEYVSSAGLRVLLIIQKKVGISIKSFVLVNLIEDVKDVLEMTGFSSILDIR